NATTRMRSGPGSREPMETKMSSPYNSEDLKTLSTEIIMLTPEVAEMLRTTCLFERQRPLSEHNIDRLAHEMRNGTFVKGTPIFVAVFPNNMMRMLNGNHTCEAVRKTGIAIPVIVIYLKVNDLEAASAIYAVLDIQKTRTWGEALKSQGAFDDFPMAKQALSAIGFIMTEFCHEPSNIAVKSRDLRFAELNRYRQAAETLAEATVKAPGANTKKLRIIPVLSVALFTARHQPSMAKEFWSGFAHDDGLQGNDPRKALLRYLNNLTGTGAVLWEDIARAAVLAWNAAFEGRKLEVCKPNQMGAFRIIGTPVFKEKKAKPATSAAQTGGVS
ncbi:MAG: hypothetical protein WCF85_21570, partial [Rhodospirillaceae bacterium]